jgi:hypothetical protein
VNDLSASFVDVAHVFKALASVPRLEILATLTPECESVSSIVARTDLPLDFPMPRWQISESDFEDLLDHLKSLE